jgi:hypothetical protein
VPCPGPRAVVLIPFVQFTVHTSEDRPACNAITSESIRHAAPNHRAAHKLELSRHTQAARKFCRTEDLL